MKRKYGILLLKWSHKVQRPAPGRLQQTSKALPPFVMPIVLRMVLLTFLPIPELFTLIANQGLFRCRLYYHYSSASSATSFVTIIDFIFFCPFPELKGN